MTALDRAEAYLADRCLKSYAVRGTRELRTCTMMATHHGKCEPLLLGEPAELLADLVRMVKAERAAPAPNSGVAP